MRAGRRQTRRRRAQSTTGLVVTLAAIGAASAAAVWFGPRVLRAEPSASEKRVAAAHPAHQVTIEQLAALIGGSQRIIAVHRRAESPLYEIVLWLTDGAYAGVVNVDEIGVLVHSEVTQCLTLSVLASPAEEARDDLASLPPRSAPTGWLPDDLRVPGFVHRWRSWRHVETRLLARELSDIELTTEPLSSGASELRISLIWSSESSDGPDKASILINAAAPTAGARE